MRTGVTVILPHDGNLFRRKVHAAVHTINAYGKPLSFEQVRESGNIESPIALTSTLNVGLVADALVQDAIKHNSGSGTWEGVGFDCRRSGSQRHHRWRAIHSPNLARSSRSFWR